MPRPVSPDPENHCRACSKLMRRKRFNGRMEDMAAFLRRKYCDQVCMAVGMVKTTKSRGQWQFLARKFKGSACEQCGTTVDLEIHHKNRDWSDNSLSNLQTLCSTCHMKLHHAAGDITKSVPRA